MPLPRERTVLLVGEPEPDGRLGLRELPPQVAGVGELRDELLPQETEHDRFAGVASHFVRGRVVALVVTHDDLARRPIDADDEEALRVVPERLSPSARCELHEGRGGSVAERGAPERTGIARRESARDVRDRAHVLVARAIDELDLISERRDAIERDVPQDRVVALCAYDPPLGVDSILDERAQRLTLPEDGRVRAAEHEESQAWVRRHVHDEILDAKVRGVEQTRDRDARLRGELRVERVGRERADGDARVGSADLIRARDRRPRDILHPVKDMPERKRAPAPELARRLNSATVHLMRVLRQDAAESGLAAEHRTALGALVFSGPMSIGDLARREQVGAPAMTKTVAILERKRFVKRTRDDRDGRVVRVQATPAGREEIIRNRNARVTRIANALAELERDDRARIEAAIVALERLILELEDTR